MRLLPEGGGAAVWVNSLATAKGEADVILNFYDQANQIVMSGKTDADGLFQFKMDTSKMVFVTAQKGDDLNYLSLADDSQSGASSGCDYEYGDCYDYEYGGENKISRHGDSGSQLLITADQGQRDYLLNGYEAFIYGPRNIYKPGESFIFKALVRDKMMMAPHSVFPLPWKVTDPDGRVLTQGLASLNEFGSLDFSAVIPFSARTGRYQVGLYLPMSNKAIGETSFLVEDFVLPRIKVSLENKEKTITGEEAVLNLTGAATYLFGAPGAGLKWELGATIYEAEFQAKGFEGFDFRLSGTDFRSIDSRRILTGELNDDGQSAIIFRPDFKAEKLPGKLMIDLILSVQEDGGRWNAAKSTASYFPHQLMLGSRLPAEISVNEKLPIDLVALRPDDQKTEAALLDVRVYKVLTRYYNAVRNGRSYRQSAIEKQLFYEAKVPLVDGLGHLTVTPDTADQYELEVVEPGNGASISRTFYAYGLAGSTVEALPDRPQISLDKANYNIGDDVGLSLKSPFTGRLWLTVEGAELYYSKVFDLPEKEMNFTFKLPAEIKTNAYVTATVIRPVSEGETVVRAAAVERLELSKEERRLAIEIESDDKFSPSSEPKILLRLKDNNGLPVQGEFSVAFVDEGVLSLTGFKTPDALNWFLALRNFQSLFFDLYSQLLPLEKVQGQFLTPGGGDGIGRSNLFSPFQRKQDVLSFFAASVKTDERGEAALTLKIPEYSGDGRLMILASKDDKFVSLSKKIKVRRELTLEVTTPLALAPGDIFEVPVKVYLADDAEEETGRSLSFQLETFGPISFLEEANKTLTIQPGGAKTFIFKAQAVSADSDGVQVGLAQVKAKSTDGRGQSFEQNFEISVRPPFARIHKTVSGQVSGGAESIETPLAEFMKGTVHARFSLSSHQAQTALVQAVEYLKNYPYGCLEQTVSMAWPFLMAQGKIDNSGANPNYKHDALYGLNSAISRLATMQAPQGYFHTWPNTSEAYEWGSVYAAHFLTEAKKVTTLPAGLHEDALKWLKRYIGADYNYSTSDIGSLLATKAYALYVLSLNDEYKVAWLNTLKERYAGLSPSARIFLAGATANFQANSEALVELENEKTDWNFSNLDSYNGSLETNVRNKALLLLMWAEVDPFSARTQALAQEVISAGHAHGWRSTQENGLVVLALNSYLQHSKAGAAFSATLENARTEVLGQGNEAKEISIDGKSFADKLTNHLKLKITGSGRPFYSLTLSGVPLVAPPPIAQDLYLERNWYHDDGRKISLNTVEDYAKPITVRKGERITVGLKLSSASATQNVVIADLLPGGFEIENPRFQAKDENAEDDLPDETEEDSYGPHMEIREDRLIIVMPQVHGTYYYSYTMRAIGAGTYHLPQTTAEAMYEPDKKAILPAGRIIVND